MNHTTISMACLLLLAAVCTRIDGAQERAEPVDATRPSVAAESAPEQTVADISPHTQRDLAAAIRQAERQSNDDRSLAFANLGDSWQGKRYRWRVYFQPSFCPAHDNCHVVPFDRRGKDKDIVQGWSPKLELSPELWTALRSGCADATGQCQLTFEGILSSFRISTEELTRLSFTQVSVIAIAGSKS